MEKTLPRYLEGVSDIDTPPASPPHQPGIASRPHFASQVSEGLSQHEILSKKTQAKWYDEIFVLSQATDALEDESYAESLEDESYAESFEDESGAESFEDGSGAESLEDGSGAESLEDKTDAESFEDETDAESLEVETDAEYLEDESDAESFENETDAESLEDETDAESFEDETDAESLEDGSDADAESLEEFSVCHITRVEVSSPSSWPEGVQFELHTLPVNAKLVGDGDGMTVHVDMNDPDEADAVPLEVQEAMIERHQARAVRDYHRADALDKIIISAGYRVINAPNGEEILAREHRIRLRGIDAPEMNMEYGLEVKDALIKHIQGKRLTIHVYEEDRYGRLVGDVYCNGVFIQEKLLRNGCAWHYKAYDKRRLFAQREARNAGRGLWVNPNPVAPWEFRREERNKRKMHRLWDDSQNEEEDDDDDEFVVLRILASLPREKWVNPFSLEGGGKIESVYSATDSVMDYPLLRNLDSKVESPFSAVENKNRRNARRERRVRNQAH